MAQKELAGAWVPAEQKKRWEELAEERGMSLSEWMSAMVEAGLKKFDRDIQPAESKDDLRKRNTELWNDFQTVAKERDRLQKQLRQTEQLAIIEFVEENQGCKYKEIAQHLRQNRGSRLTKLLDVLDGEEIEIDEDGRVYRL